MTLGMANLVSGSQYPYLEIQGKGWVFMLSKDFLSQTVTPDTRKGYIKELGDDS